MKTIPFPDKSFSASRRIDPFHEGLWDGGGTGVSWTSIAQAQAQSANGRARIPAAWKMSQEQALDVIGNSRNRNRVISVMGALFQWQNLTAEQLADITGYKGLAATFEDRHHSSKVLLALFTLGLIEYGEARDGVWEKQRKHAPKMYRVTTRPQRYERLIAHNLSWAEQLAVTAGLPAVGGRNAGRHNILASELGLRAAETLPIGTVFGERLCGVDALNYQSAGRRPSHPQTGFADLCVVRSDGLKIVFEVTASGSAGLARKAVRWAQTLAQSHVEDTGVVVVFLEAYPAHRSKSAATDTWNKTRKAVRTAVRDIHTGDQFHPTSQRMFVARWQDWFPTTHQYSGDFLTFKCEGATGQDRLNPWEPAYLLNARSGYEFSPREPEQMLAPIALSSTLAGTPVSLRRSVPGFYEELNEIAARSRGLPASLDMAPVRERSEFRRAESRGAAGEPTLAKRLTWGSAGFR